MNEDFLRFLMQTRALRVTLLGLYGLADRWHTPVGVNTCNAHVNETLMYPVKISSHKFDDTRRCCAHRTGRGGCSAREL